VDARKWLLYKNFYNHKNIVENTEVNMIEL